MKILITGITGRIGANLASALVKQGHTVRGLVWPRDPRVDKLKGLGIDLQRGTITNTQDVRHAVDGMEAVYHLGAAFQGGGPFTEDEYFEINVRGVFNMLEAARANARLKQLIFASTDAVLQKYVPGGLHDPIKEDVMPRRPAGWYAISKSMGEELMNGYFRTYNTPVTVLRFPYVVGAGEMLDFPQFYLSKLKDNHPELAQAWDGQERLVVLKDENGRDYKKHICEVRDIVSGLVAALGKQAALGQTIQLAAPRPFTWAEAVPYLASKLNTPYIEAKVTGIPVYYEFDLSKARNLIGFEPKYDILKIIDAALAFRSGESMDILPTN